MLLYAIFGTSRQLMVTVSAVIAIYAFSLALWDSLDSVLFDWAPFVRDNAIYTYTSMGLTT